MILFQSLQLLLIWIHMFDDGVGGHRSNHPQDQTLGLELLTFRVNKGSDCQSICASEATEFRVAILDTTFAGHNMLATQRPFNLNPMQFYIDECLRYNNYCMGVSDVWLTDDEGPGSAPEHEEDPQSIEYAINLWQERASKCRWKIASSQSSESKPGCTAQSRQLAKRTCMCRIILVIVQARTAPPMTRKDSSKGVLWGNDPPWRKAQPITDDSAHQHFEDDNSFCDLNNICKRFGMRVFPTHFWFCRQGFFIREAPFVGSSSWKSDNPKRCACARKRKPSSGKKFPCFSAEEIFDSMRLAKLTPVGSIVWTYYELFSGVDLAELGLREGQSGMNELSLDELQRDSCKESFASTAREASYITRPTSTIPMNGDDLNNDVNLAELDNFMEQFKGDKFNIDEFLNDDFQTSEPRQENHPNAEHNRASRKHKAGLSFSATEAFQPYHQAKRACDMYEERAHAKTQFPETGISFDAKSSQNPAGIFNQPLRLRAAGEIFSKDTVPDNEEFLEWLQSFL